MAALGGPIYAIGGLDDNSCFNDVERYDIESDCWSAVAPMNTPRGGVGSVALGVRLALTTRPFASVAPLDFANVTPPSPPELCVCSRRQ